jgi:hypothetical protein
MQRKDKAGIVSGKTAVSVTWGHSRFEARPISFPNHEHGHEHANGGLDVPT